MASEKKVLTNYNLLRIMAIIMVISTHMLGQTYIADAATEPVRWHVREIIRTLTLTCNGLFFMLSGRFILEKKFDNIWGFYWDRIVKMGIPVFLVTTFNYIYIFGFSPDMAYLKNYIKLFFQAKVLGYLWFVFALAGFYLAAPFIARMLRNMPVSEKKILLAVSFVWFVVEDLYHLERMEMVFTSYIFYSWAFYCVLGYLLDTMELSKRQKHILILSGFAGLIISSLEEFYIPGQNAYIHDYAPSMILMTVAVYIAVTEYGNVISRRLEKIINFVARYIFFVYLFHGFTQNLIIMDILTETPHGYGMWIILTAASFCLALLMSIAAYHIVYKPMLKLLLPKKREISK